MIEFAKKILVAQNNDLKNLKDLNEILHNLIHDEVRNPRKVISLLNNFAADFELIMKREGRVGVLQTGDVSDNLKALAVFTVLKTDYPNYYQLLVKDTDLFQYLFDIDNGQIDNFAQYQKDIITGIYKDFNKLSSKDFTKEYVDDSAKEFVDFIRRVDDTIRDIDDINLFIYLDRDMSTSALPSARFRTLRNYVKGGAKTEVKRMLEEANGPDDIINHFNIIRITIGELRSQHEIKKSLQCLFHVVELIPGVENNNMKLIAKVAMEKMNSLASNRGKWVEDFNLGGLFFTLQFLDSQITKNGIIEFLITSLSNTSNKDFADKIIRAVFKYENLLDYPTLVKLISVLKKRKPINEQDVAIYFTLENICDYINEFRENKKTISRFFNTDIADEICDRLLLNDSEKEKDDKEGKEYTLLAEAMNIIDNSLSETNIGRQIEIYIKLLPTTKYYFELIKKIEAIKSKVPSEKAVPLIEALCNEVGNVDGDNFVKLLGIIDELSALVKERPIKPFITFQDSLPQVVLDDSSVEEIDPALDYFKRFADDRFSVESIGKIIAKLLDGIKISKNLERSKKIIDFLSNNLNLLSKENSNNFSKIIIREIFDSETYIKFANNEGIGYLKAIYSKILSLEDREREIADIDLKNSIISDSNTSFGIFQRV